MKKKDYIKQGKKNKAMGKAFEDKVYADLEKMGWVVSRWMKNVEKVPFFGTCSDGTVLKAPMKLIPAKPSIRMIPGKGPMLVSTWTGFPDFIAFRVHCAAVPVTWEIVGVECKTNGKLDKEEKEKCEWLLENNVFSKILIASKGDKRGQIICKEYARNNN